VNSAPVVKLGADVLVANGGKLLSAGAMGVTGALTLYGVTTLAFLLVPVASHFLLGESFTLHYVFGCALLVAGVVLTSAS